MNAMLDRGEEIKGLYDHDLTVKGGLKKEQIE